MKAYLNIAKEIASTTASKITYTVDIMLFFFNLIIPFPELPKYIYILILLIGFFLSTLEIISGRDKFIAKLKNTNIPAITLYFKEVDRRTVLKIMNLWSEPIKDVQTSHIRLSRIFSFGFALSGTNILRSGERRELVLVDGKNNPYSRQEFLASFNPKYLNKEIEIIFAFKDFKNNKYKATMRFEKKGIRCVSIITI